nr:hypothetical protein [Tanacetum cinerariifolium]
WDGGYRKSIKITEGLAYLR